MTPEEHPREESLSPLARPAFQPGLRPAPAVRPWPRKLALLCPGFPSSKTG